MRPIVALVTVCLAGWSIAFGQTETAQVNKYLKQLKSPKADQRRAAADALGELGPVAKAAVKSLIEATKDADKGVVTSAISALGRIGPDAKDAVNPLATILVRDKAHRATAATALARIGKASVPRVGKLLTGKPPEDKDVRIACADVLAKMDPVPAEAVGMLGDALSDADPTVKNHALDALKKLGPAAKDAVKPIAKLAGDKVFTKKAVDVLVALVPRVCPRCWRSSRTPN
jgi:HEAT repeat protein